MYDDGCVPDLLAVADDLSGACEVAAALGGPGSSVLLGGPVDGASAGRVAVVDLDCRYADPGTAEAETARTLAASEPGADLFVKIDSLLRGNVAAAVRAALALGRPAVLAPALPESGRVVRDGVPIVRGVPLPDTGLWLAELRRPPATVQEALDDVPAEGVPLDVVRSGPAVLRRRLQLLAERGRLAIVDGVADPDLDALVAAAWGWADGPGPVLLGSAGLAAAIGRRPPGLPPFASIETAGGPPLVIVGSGSEAASRQFRRLVEEVDCIAVELDAARLLAEPGEARAAVAAAARRSASAVAVRVQWPIGLGVGSGPAVTEAFAAVLADALGAVPQRPVALIGGATARGVLDRLGVRRLTVLGSLPAGAVVSRTDGGVTIVTRPGSFGEDGHLIDILRTGFGRLDLGPRQA